jgi:16S rRNA (guanine966-N2)-methyltransferase
MRVIAGKYRSRSLSAPPGIATRPTSDRLRETLFNVLAPRIEGASFADLFAGSGAIGIEALSRGASHVCFIENASPAVAAIRANLAALNIKSGFRIVTRGIPAALYQASRQSSNRPWDIVFLDPPYIAQAAYGSALTTLSEVAPSLLAPGGIVIAEHRRKNPLMESYSTLNRYRILEQGDALLSFYHVAGSE